MRYRSWRLPASIVAILLIAATAGAPPLLPPSLSIRQSENAVAVVTVLERVEADRLRVRRDVVLQEDFVVVDGGLEPPTEIVVTVGEEVAAGATVGEAYILGYTSLNPVPKQKHTFSVDPEGPQIFRIPSVGPALLPDSPPLRKLVTPRATEEELSPRERLDLILAQLEEPGLLARRFVVAELALWRNLPEALTAKDIERFRTVLEAGELAPESREYLLRVFLPLHETWGGDWVAAEARRAITEYDPEMDLASGGPALVKQALEALAVVGRPEDTARVLEFLSSNNAAVTLEAFRTAVALDPAHTEKVAEDLFWEGELPGDTMDELTRFLSDRQAAREPAEDPS